MNQSEIVKSLSDEELKKSLFMSQLLFGMVAIIASIFIFEKFTDWLNYFTLDYQQLIYFGLFSGLFIVMIDLIIMFIFPKHAYDDGGINERIFKALSVQEIVAFCLLIAVSEELLFRGVIQTTFGYWIASVIFALVHIRYLKKPVLFISVLIVSFFIGYLFEITGNLNVTILAHFTVDFVLGLIIHFKK